MTHRLLVLPFLLAAAACGSATSPSSTTNTLPLSYTFTAALLPANEVPAVSNSEAGGSGTVTITMAVTRDSGGSVTAATANFSVSLSGFPAGTTLTGAHIHAAGPGQTAGVSVSTGLANGEVVMAAGSASFTKSNINVAVDTANGMIINANSYYFNVHSTLNTGGVARGQLVKQ
jgi:hypothetical protein